ncbi:hypothetical protein IM40_04750 [Candidatus Paracaedimonas acanthamoebae]|nr:hypothetical protein IM40_04750 [Candidatus Paracaedimonas acanthamoebae]
MKILNLFLLISSSTLLACNQHKREAMLDSEPPVQAPLPPHAPIQPLVPGQSEKAKSIVIMPLKQESSSAIVIPEKAPVDQPIEWHPKEGDLVRAGEFVMKLKQERGSNPTSEEMVSYLQDNMAISASQAHLILEELGLE